MATQWSRVAKLWERGDSGMRLLLDTQIKNTRKKKEVLAYQKGRGAILWACERRIAVQAGYPR